METLHSLFLQTVPVNYILLLTEKMEGVNVPEKISRILNNGVKGLQLEAFDYVLRVDADTVLPPNFVEENLRLQADCCGGAGNAMIFRTSTFKKVCGDRFHVESDDTHIYHSFQASGYKVAQVATSYRKGEVSRKYNQRKYWCNDGKLNYMLGYMPHQVIAHLRIGKLSTFYQLFGYFKALFMRYDSFNFANRYRMKYLKENWVRMYVVKAAKWLKR